MSLQKFNNQQTFQLESGRKLSEIQLAYTTLGKLNASKNNVVWITHALTANADPVEWWNGLVGKGKFFDTETHFIICANALGSPYGSTNPLSVNPDTGNKYHHNFPEITIRDIVNALDLLRKHLGITKINTLLGGSLGGQQAVEWAIQQPELIENLFLIATNAQHSPWGIAFNESQRLAIKADRTWFSYSDDAGLKGLKAARSIALLSYRNYTTYQATQIDEDEKTRDFHASSYQNYQGNKLVSRFNAFSYWYLSKAMDSHNVGRNRGGIKAALAKIKSNTLVVGISSDILFPLNESEVLANNINNAQLEVIDSIYGHDGFLIETEQLRTIFENFYYTQKLKKNFMNIPTKNSALIGFGTVGQGFYLYFSENNSDKQLATVVIKDKNKTRIPSNLNFTIDVDKTLKNKDITTLIELISDDKEAFRIVKKALETGKKIVSANKKMIAYHLEELVQLENEFGGKFLYEGAVAGSIPIIKIINEHYAFDKITEVKGILNGTSNYILTQIFEKGISYEEALFQAQEAGFAEEDPTADVGGFDALYKLLILSAHAFGKFIHPEKALNIGIENISNSDIAFAKNRLKIKLIASALNQSNKLILNVLPTFVDEKDDLFNVNNEYNAVEIVSNNIGSQIYKGKGAGKFPTGHVVYTDFVASASNKYTYKNIPSGKKLKYETKEFIWVYSNKITLLEKYLEDVLLINGSEGCGKIKIADLIKAKELIHIHQLSIIGINDTIKQQVELKSKRVTVY